MTPASENKSKQLFLKNLNLLIRALALVVTLLVVWFFAKNTFSAAQEIDKKNQQLAQRESVIAKTIANLKAINFQTEKDRLAAVDQFFPTQKDPFEILSLVEYLAGQSNLKVLSLAEAGRSEGENENGYTIQTSLEGSYDAILNFFSALYQTKRAIGIKSASFNPQDAGGQTFELGLTFYLPLVQAASESKIDKAVSTFTADEEKIIKTLSARTISQPATESAKFGRHNPFSEFESPQPIPKVTPTP